jgi:hypothetical protein
MGTWTQIGTLILAAVILVIFWPRAAQMLRNSRKAQPDEWQALLVPIGAVAIFVFLLIWLVSR